MAKQPASVKAVFDRALEIAAGAERSAFLDQACAGDPELRQKVETLLAAYAAAGSFVERPHLDPIEPDRVSAPGPTGPDLTGQAEGPGTRIGPYKLLERIGEGGMGTVWMAEQQQPVRRRVALKVLEAGLDSAQVIARFDAERQALALMDHPHIARVFDGGLTDTGRPWFVMELVKGTPITKYCDEHRLMRRERLELFVPVCQAIQHAHQKGIIHRDVKPSNVLVAPYDGVPVVKVIDFGIAKAIGQPLTDRTLFTGFGAVVGTLEYLSPEQAELNNHDIDTRSDVYSLGVLLYELLTGTTPLTREQMKQTPVPELLRLIREQEPPRPSTRLSDSRESLPSISAQRQVEAAQLPRLVRGELDCIVMKSLDKDRGRRYLGPDHIETLTSLNNLAVAIGQAGRPAEAEAILRQSLAISASKEPEAWTTFLTRSLLGGALLNQKKYADAEPLLLEGYQGMKERQAKIPSHNQVDLTEALERLVRLYEGWGKKAEAQQWGEKLRQHQKAIPAGSPGR
jgi:serine/threonine protein kinase